MCAAVIAATGCTNQEISAWLKWHRSDPAAAQAHLALPEVQESIRQTPKPAPAASSAASGNTCVGLIDTLAQQSPGWDVNRMARIAYRESRCQPSASNSCCTGVLQIHAIWIPKAASCGVYSRSDLQSAWKNVCVAAIIYRQQGMGAWSL